MMCLTDRSKIALGQKSRRTAPWEPSSTFRDVRWVSGVSTHLQHLTGIIRVNSQNLIGRTAPSHRLGIVSLYILTRPDVGALNGQQNVAPIIHNAVHHNPIEHRASTCSKNLRKEGCSGWKLCILCQLEVAQHLDGLHQGIGSIEGEHHVRYRSARNHVSPNHLDGTCWLIVEPNNAIHARKENGQDPGQQDGKEERPPGEASLLLVTADQANQD